MWWDDLGLGWAGGWRWRWGSCFNINRKPSTTALLTLSLGAHPTVFLKMPPGFVRETKQNTYCKICTIPSNLSFWVTTILPTLITPTHPHRRFLILKPRAWNLTLDMSPFTMKGVFFHKQLEGRLGKQVYRSALWNFGTTALWNCPPSQQEAGSTEDEYVFWLLSNKMTEL